MKKPDSVVVTLDFKVLQLAGTWNPNNVERDAAWELYVELVTRIGVVPLRDGSLREALSSLYSLFATTRSILQKYGPAVAESRGDDQLNFGYLAVGLLNDILRPRLAFWHPALMDWESGRSPADSALQHERQWDRELEARGEIDIMGEELRQFVQVLAEVCGVPATLRP